MNRIYKCFPGGKFKVLTLSYDDGKLEDKRLVDIFNKNGIRATFNVNSGLTDMPIRLPASEWNDLYDNHEIALHTCTHPTMNRWKYIECPKWLKTVYSHTLKLMKKKPSSLVVGCNHLLYLCITIP